MRPDEFNLVLLTEAWVSGYSRERRQLLHFTFEIGLYTKTNHQISTINPLASNTKNVSCLKEKCPTLSDSSYQHIVRGKVINAKYKLVGRLREGSDVSSNLEAVKSS